MTWGHDSGWLVTYRRFLLAGYDSLVWAVCITAFAYLRNMDVTAGGPRRAVVFAMGMAVLSLTVPGSRIIALSVPVGAGAMAILRIAAGRIGRRMRRLTGQAMLDGEDTKLCDLRNAEALESVFAGRQPQVAFHAAALKHLPMPKQFPEEAWKTNVLGSLNVLTCAPTVDVDVFVSISTDKSANPCSLLGYSKRIAERLAAGVAAHTRDEFVSVRFGRGLVSRGSVLTAFAEPVALGGHVTVTHPEVTWFFMMIPEACELVVQASGSGTDSDALVLEVGGPVRILEVAEQIAMRGEPHAEISFTSLRDGERLQEELFGDRGTVRPTGHHLMGAVGEPALKREDLSPVVDWDAAIGTFGV